MKRTFILCQEILYQIYAIHALNNNHILPCVVILLPIINEDTYNRLFREVKDAVIRQGNELLIFSKILQESVNTVTSQVPQLQVMKVNFNLIYGSCVFIST